MRRFFGELINENRVFFFILKKYSRLINENSLFYENYIYVIFYKYFYNHKTNNEAKSQPIFLSNFESSSSTLKIFIKDKIHRIFIE